MAQAAAGSGQTSASNFGQTYLWLNQGCFEAAAGCEALYGTDGYAVYIMERDAHPVLSRSRGEERESVACLDRL